MMTKIANCNPHNYTDILLLKFSRQQKEQINQFDLWYQYELEQCKISPKVQNANWQIFDVIEC